MNKIINQAKLVQKVLQNCKWIENFSMLRVLNDFPRGCCRVASIVLAYNLVDFDLCSPNEIKFSVNGRRKWNGKSWIKGDFSTDGIQIHAWLIIKDYTLDITGYYFDDQNEELVFSKESSWHKTFYSPDFLTYSEMMKFNERFKKDFNLFYGVFKEKLKEF
jgi:hypothetical protein